MTHRLFLLVALLSLGLTACSPTAEPAAVPLSTAITKPTTAAATDEPTADLDTKTIQPDQEFTLSYGQTVELATTGETVTFKTVEDSRCPEGMACVWAGSLIVGLDVVDNNGQTVAIDLSLDDPTVTAQGQLPSGLKITLVDDGPEASTSVEAWQITLIVQA